MAENKTKLSYDDFVSKVVKDPKQPPDTILLTGYVGESSEEGHSRIYFDPQLTQYVEVPHDAVLHTQPIPKESSSLGGHHIWIKRDAELIHGKVGPERTKARFFEGPIGAQAAAAHGGPVTAPPACHPITAPTACACPVTIIPLHCPTHAPELCPTHLPLHCPTHQPGVVCPPSPPPILCPHTPLHGCPTPPVFCPHTPLHGCPTPPVLCPHTPLHGCPTPPVICPIPTLAELHCTPACPTNPAHCVTQICPSVHIPCQSVPACPSGFVCGTPAGGVGGDPAAAHAGFAHPAGLSSFPCPTAVPTCPTSPAVCHPSANHICPTSPVFCHPTPACPSVHHLCPSNPVICVPSPLTCPSHHICPTSPVICVPSPLTCPSHHICPTSPVICPRPSAVVACPTFGACPSALGCPSGPACGGGGPIGGGGGPVF